jgi:hypothetical protein
MKYVTWMALAIIFFTACFSAFEIGISMSSGDSQHYTQNINQQPAVSKENNNYIIKIINNIISATERNDKAIVAISTVVIAAFTVFLSIATVLLFLSSEKVAETAKISADSARQSAELTDLALKATQRAVVTMPQFLTTVGIDSSTNKAVAFYIQAFWENSGATTALEVEAGIAYEQIASKIVETVNFKNSPFIEKQSLSIAPRTKIMSNATVSINTIYDIWNKKLRLFILARSEYKDVFGIPHHFQICAELTVVSDPGQTIPDPKNTPPIVAFSIWREHNSSS